VARVRGLFEVWVAAEPRELPKTAEPEVSFRQSA
jgi:hypothetical protein